jgi:hypothetical protein
MTRSAEDETHVSDAQLHATRGMSMTRSYTRIESCQ